MEYNASKIKKYYLNLKKTTNFLPWIFQFISFSISLFLLIFIADIKISKFEFWFIFFVFNIFTFIQIITFRKNIQPHLDLMKLFLNNSLKAQAEKNPQISNRNYKKTGFDEVLKMFLAINKNQAPSQRHKNYLSLDKLEDLEIGISVLNSKNKEIFNTSKSIELSQIKEKQNILSWISDVRKSKIKAQKVFERISVNQGDKELIFDLVVFFNRDSLYEVTFFWIDKTENYSSEESDFNFISFATHEIRGPITIIRGYLDILDYELSSIISPQQQEIISRLIVSANKLNSYVNNVLQVSKFGQNRLDFETSEISIREVFEQISDDVSIRANTQGRKLEISIPHNLPTVSGNIVGVGQVLTNLVDNAIKYSHSGGLVKISAKDTDQEVEIKIQDFGIGIPTNVMEKLFTKFYRSHRSRETVAGSGIGLYISQAIMQNMNGRISVESKEGEGSIFTVFLPKFKKSKKIKIENQTKIKNHGKIY